jgi:hypothetical protein
VTVTRLSRTVAIKSHREGALAYSDGPKGRSRWPKKDCPFEVVCTNGSDEVLVYANNLLIGRAAFETAKRLFPRDQRPGARAEPAIAAEGRDRRPYPRDVLEYRNGAQVIERSGG